MPQSYDDHNFFFFFFFLVEYPGVVSVFPNRGHKVHTTRSWKFMGLERDGAGAVAGDSLWTRARFGEDTIIANLDTGIFFIFFFKINSFYYYIIVVTFFFLSIFISPFFFLFFRGHCG